MSALVVNGQRWEVRRIGAGAPVLLVHGFTGRGRAWEPHTRALARRFSVVAVDLPGHGRSGIPASPAAATVERAADDLAEILERTGSRPAHVVGYSLGARIALRLAIAHPSAVLRLVLESPSAGLAGEDERVARREADEHLAERIERDGVERFVDEWEALPLFASQRLLSPVRAARLHALRLANRPAGLAVSLRGAGQGAMEPLHDRLASVTAPTLVIAGTRDKVGRARASIVAAGIPGARLEIVERAGHTAHLEAPAAFRRLLVDFLTEDAP